LADVTALEKGRKGPRGEKEEGESLAFRRKKGAVRFKRGQGPFSGRKKMVKSPSQKQGKEWGKGPVRQLLFA